MRVCMIIVVLSKGLCQREIRVFEQDERSNLKRNDFFSINKAPPPETRQVGAPSAPAQNSFFSRI